MSKYVFHFAFTSASQSIICWQTVTAAWKEPYSGWVEGMNGPTGLIIGAARGKPLNETSIPL